MDVPILADMSPAAILILAPRPTLSFEDKCLILEVETYQKMYEKPPHEDIERLTTRIQAIQVNYIQNIIYIVGKIIFTISLDLQ